MTPAAVSERSSASAGETQNRLWRWMMLCAGASVILYLVLPGIAAMIISSKASYAFEIFPWVRSFTKDSLLAFHETLVGDHGKMWFFLVCAALILIYAVMLRLAKGCISLSAQWMVFGAGSVCMLSLLLSPVMLSTD